MTLRKAVLPVAGFGTRVLPATKAIPKELLPVVDRPVIQYVVDEALAAGIEHIVFVTGRGKGAIEDYFDHAFELEAQLREKGRAALLAATDAARLPAGRSSFIRQQSARGLGHAVWCARDVIGHEPFAVLLPDVILKATPSALAQMCAAFNACGGNIIAVDPVPADRVSLYGVIDPEGRDGRLIRMRGMVEKPPAASAPSNLAITGRYILQPEIFDILERQAPGAGGEIQLTDAMATLMQSQPFYAYEFDGRPYDCGTKAGYFEASLAFALDHPEIASTARSLVRQAAEEL